MKKHFVRTANLEALELGVDMLKECGAREARWMLATGRPGEGKTTTLYHLGAKLNAIFVTAHQGWRPAQMIKALALEMKVFVGRDADANLGEALAAEGAENRLIIIDEAQFALGSGAACLERLRGITDKSGTPVILVAMQEDVTKFGRHEQISSRIFNWVKFQPASKEDVGKACQQLAEVQIAADLVDRIHADTDGRMRDVIKAISRIEMAAKALGRDPIGAADVRRTTLVEDYRAGIPKPVVKPSARGGV